MHNHFIRNNSEILNKETNNRTPEAMENEKNYRKIATTATVTDSIVEPQRQFPRQRRGRKADVTLI